MTLQSTLEQRKNLHIPDIIDTNREHIIDVKYISIDDIVYIGLITKTKSTINCLLTSFPKNFPQSTYHKIELKRKDKNLSGHTFCLIYNKYLYFLTLCKYSVLLLDIGINDVCVLGDDNQMFAYLVASPNNQEVDTNYTESFGSLFCQIESISCKQNVAMVPIGSDHIAIYGADCNQEGACVLMYNTQFKVTQSKQTFKMFSNITKIWNIDNILLLCSGQHLAVIPFEVNTEQLSQLVGSHKIDVTDTDVQQTYTIEKWDIEESDDYSSTIPSNIKESVLNCVGQGLSETVTCDILIPTYIKNFDSKAIESCVNYFKDISEECLVKIIVYLIENQLSYNDEQIPNRDDLIDKVLSIPFTNILLLPHIKGAFNINITLALLKYISLLFSSETCLPELSFVQTESKLIDWACVLLDGNYQKFLLSRDNIVHETLKNFNILVQEHLLGLNDLQCVEPVISDFVKGKCLNGTEQSNVNYCIEEVKLY